METNLKVLLITLICIQKSHAWSEIFDYTSCYETIMEERMPLSVDNLIAIVEAYEKDAPNTEPGYVANAVLNRYRQNGVIFNPRIANFPWARHDQNEVYKQTLDDALVEPYLNVPEDIFYPREECSLHMMMSHSTDLYPHSGVDYIWQDYSERRRRSTQYEIDIADHPIENGVIQTPGGPVAGGILMSGLSTMVSRTSFSVADLVGRSEAEKYMKQEMMEKQVSQYLGSTLAGELAQAAILNGRAAQDQDFGVGPVGRFANSSCCARLFSLQNNQVSSLSRAELFASLDALIIGAVLGREGPSRQMGLSEILRMYYSDHGLLDRRVKACNRLNLFKGLQNGQAMEDRLYDQSLNYMYALQHYYSEIKGFVASEEFEEVERQFKLYLDPVFQDVKNFLRSYPYDDPDYTNCGQELNGENAESVFLEEETNMVVIFTPTGSSFDMQKQAQYISQTARKIGVGYHRSRVLVLNGNKNQWVPPMRNRSNIADYACNVTTLTNLVSGGNQDFLDVLDRISQVYDRYYSRLRSDPDLTGARSQVVLWNLPKGFNEDEESITKAWNVFNMTYPDVNIIFAGSSLAPLEFLFQYDDNFDADKIFVQTSSSDEPDDIANGIVALIKKAPKMFVYAACDTLNDTWAEYSEGNHVYRSYVSPNFTTLIRIPPQNFRFSEYVKLMFSNANIDVCVSRLNPIPSAEDSEDVTTCSEAPFDWEQWEMCGQYMEECDPIYIAVTGQKVTNSYCSDEMCQFSNQIEFEFTHEGMICAGVIQSISTLLVAFVFCISALNLRRYS